MARRPFFSGNYGSALGSTANAANLIARAGQQQGQMYANMGQQIGGMIQQYGLNKEKRNKLQATLEGQLSADPSIVQQLTMTGDEDYDKKNMKLFDKVQSGDASIADLERANGLLAGKTTQENAMLKKENAETQQKMNKLNLSLQEALKDPTIRKAVGEANRAEAMGNYASSVVSAEYAAKVQDNALKSAQTEYQRLKTDLLKSGESYTKGDVIEREGVKFIYTGETFQPLNEGVSRKAIEEAMIRGLDQAQLKVYLDDNYEYDQKTDTYTFDGSGFFGGKRNPMMEEAITILGLRGKVKDEDSVVTEEPTSINDPSIDEHKSANEEAKSSGKMFYILNGKKFTVQ